MYYHKKHENHQIKLIGNSYYKEYAKYILSVLLNDKIKFLQMKNFSLEEPKVADNQHPEKRVKELIVEKNQLISKIKELGEKQ
jgi:hypothetical protein